MHVVVIDADSLQMTTFSRVRSGFRIVETALDFNRLVNFRVHTHAQPHPVFRRVLAGQSLRCLFQQAFIIFPMGAIDKESVAAATASDTADFARNLADSVSDPGKHAIAVLLAITFVQHMEIVDVEHDGVHRHVGVVLVVHANVTQEEIEREKVCHAVTLGSLDDAPLFRKLYAAINTRLDDFLRGVRLGDEVDCPKLEAFHLRILIGSHHDNRYVLELLLLLHDLEHF